MFPRVQPVHYLRRPDQLELVQGPLALHERTGCEVLPVQIAGVEGASIGDELPRPIVRR